MPWKKERNNTGDNQRSLPPSLWLEPAGVRELESQERLGSGPQPRGEGTDARVKPASGLLRLILGTAEAGSRGVWAASVATLEAGVWAASVGGRGLTVGSCMAALRIPNVSFSGGKTNPISENHSFHCFLPQTVEGGRPGEGPSFLPATGASLPSRHLVRHGCPCG